MATEFPQRAITITVDTYFVFYDDHERGSAGGMFVRNGLESAERSERLLGECGYRWTETRHAASLAEMPVAGQVPAV